MLFRSIRMIFVMYDQAIKFNQKEEDYSQK